MARRPKPVDYVVLARSLDWNGLDDLWAQIAARATPGWAAGKAFEHFILRAFELCGAEVAWPYQVPLGGQIIEQIDGMIHAGSITCMVEAKDTNLPINIEPLAKLRNQIARRSAGVIGAIFSFGGFADSTKTLARFMAPQTILLWDHDEIAAVLARRDFGNALQEKYRYLLKTGFPDYDPRAEYNP